MFDWVPPTVQVIQLVINLGALVGGAVIWKMYVANLQAALTAKNAEISSVEKSRDLWKEKAEELEKRSPDVVERVLEERIQVRGREIERLAEDREKNTAALEVLERERSGLQADLSRTRGFRLMLAIDEGDEDLPASPVQDIQVVLLGAVAVDSGQLMVTDPCYIDDDWRRPRTLTEDEEKNWPPSEPLADPRDSSRTREPYSYLGACATTLSAGYGELAFEPGHPGAGVVFSTAWGDGMYPIYGELHDGRIVRAYVNVA